MATDITLKPGAVTPRVFDILISTLQSPRSGPHHHHTNMERCCDFGARPAPDTLGSITVDVLEAVLPSFRSWQLSLTLVYRQLLSQIVEDANKCYDIDSIASAAAIKKPILCSKQLPKK